MRLRRLVVAMAVVAAFTACSGRHESMTGSYGDGMLSGEVIVTGTRSSSPDGVEVSVRGTGMTVTLSEDGAFAFAGVPEGALLDFRRASDGIAASLRVAEGSGHVVVEVQGNAAKKSSRRRGVGKGPERVYEFEGVIRSSTAASIVVFTSKREEVTIALGPNTVIRKGDQRLTAADLLVDTRVHVKATKAGEAYTALEVKVQEDDKGEDDDPPAVREYEGIVRSAAANQLVVFTSRREEVTFALTAETDIRKGNTPIAAADIQTGWRVHVKATVNADGTKTATRVIVQNTSGGEDGEKVELRGTVASVAASSLVVATTTGEVTVRITNGTQIRRGNKKITLAAITAGNKVEVEGRRIDATTIEAKKIAVEE
jgi:hypothetical protein